MPGLRVITTAASGNFFAMRTSELAFGFAAKDVLPGYIEIGRR